MKLFLAANLIGVKDVNKAQKWYATVFKMKLVELKAPDFCEMKLGNSHFLLEKSSKKRAIGFQKIPTGVQISAIIGVDNIDMFIKHCKKREVHIIQKPIQQKWGGWNAIIKDPDGNSIIIDQD